MTQPCYSGTKRSPCPSDMDYMRISQSYTHYAHFNTIKYENKILHVYIDTFPKSCSNIDDKLNTEIIYFQCWTITNELSDIIKSCDSVL